MIKIETGDIKKLKVSGIYAIVNSARPTIYCQFGKPYVGQSVFIGSRLKSHIRNLKKQTHANTYLKKSWNKYGESVFNFYFIENVAPDNLTERENFWIDYFHSNKGKFGYNQKKGTNSPKGQDFYLTIDEALNSARTLGIISPKDYWKKYKKDEKLPCHPECVYCNNWINWWNFLGIPEIEYYSFEEAKIAVQKLDIKTKDKYFISYKIDSRLPSQPVDIYKEWKGWGDFLGTRSVSSSGRIFMDFQEARTFVHSLNLRGQGEWNEWCKNNRPNNIPANPYSAYSDEGWKSWRDWIGNKKYQKPNKKCYATLEEASTAAQKLKIKSAEEYWIRYKEDDLLHSLPKKIYSDWSGWGKFLGTNSIAPFNKVFLDFEEARKFAHSLKLKNTKEWAKWSKNKPCNIPADPSYVYSDEGWMGWSDWLNNKDYKKRRKKCYLTLKEASIAAQKLGIKSVKEYCKKYKEDCLLHFLPEKIYPDWNGWGEFLGKI